MLKLMLDGCKVYVSTVRPLKGKKVYSNSLYMPHMFTSQYCLIYSSSSHLTFIGGGASRGAEGPSDAKESNYGMYSAFKACAIALQLFSWLFSYFKSHLEDLIYDVFISTSCAVYL